MNYNFIVRGINSLKLIMNRDFITGIGSKGKITCRKVFVWIKHDSWWKFFGNQRKLQRNTFDRFWIDYSPAWFFVKIQSNLILNIRNLVESNELKLFFKLFF